MKQLLFKKRSFDIATLLITGTILICVLAQSQAANSRRAPNAIWVHDQLYSTIGTPTSFQSPPEQSTDVIYSFAGSGLEGQRSVAEVAPGDPEYNGGRWRVMAVMFTEQGLMTFDGDNDGVVDAEITNAELLWMYVESGDLEVIDTGTRFECPLLPNRGVRQGS
jgi:hypothetical protein